MGIKIAIDGVSLGVSTTLAAIPAGAIFLGTIDGYVSAGPFVKVGSLSADNWIVAKLEALDGGVWLSKNSGDRVVAGYQRLDVTEIRLLLKGAK